MGSTRASTGPFEPLSAGERSALAWSAAGLAVIAWAGISLVHLGSSHGHEVVVPHGWPLDPLGLALATAIWFGMMVAMMTPAVWPWLPLLASATRSHRAGRPLASVPVFLTGYFVVWAGFSLVAALLQILLQQHALLQAPDLRLTAVPGAIVLLAGGTYQFTQLKTACLDRCRTPIGFFLSRWRSGPAGALSMGARHGIYCLGCCWALMAVAFALGVLNLVWMAAITALIAAERLLPSGPRVARVAGAAMIAAAFWLLASGTH